MLSGVLVACFLVEEPLPELLDEPFGLICGMRTLRFAIWAWSAASMSSEALE